MAVDCVEKIYSEDYQDYIVEYYGDPAFLNEKYGDDCFQLISERFAVAYSPGDAVRSNVNIGAYLIPHCYGLMSSEEVLEASGINRVQRQPALSLYGQGVMVGFIDTGDGVRIYFV